LKTCIGHHGRGGSERVAIGAKADMTCRTAYVRF
jgi:hypothetical protein